MIFIIWDSYDFYYNDEWVLGVGPSWDINKYFTDIKILRAEKLDNILK